MALIWERSGEAYYAMVIRPDGEVVFRLVVEELPEGGLRILLRAPDQGRIARLVLRLGADGRITDPPELADQVRKTAAEALALYGVTDA